MINFSYNLSDPLKNSLEKILLLRQQLLSIPISPKNQLSFRFEGNVNKIYWILHLSGNKVDKKEVLTVLMNDVSKKRLQFNDVIIGSKKTLDFLYFDFNVTKKPLSKKIVYSLYENLCTSRKISITPDFQEVLTYVDLSLENPIIQASIMYIETIVRTPFSERNGEMASMLSYAYLSKFGFDCLGMVVLEETWLDQIAAYRDITDRVSSTNNLTLWLEYYAESMVKQLEKALERISKQTGQMEIAQSFWQLTDRQKSILYYLDEPSKRISNRKAQSLLQISQITAARDLARLTLLGLIFSHGKGRSVYYTRV